MAGSTTKKVLIRRFERESLTGYVSPQGYQQPSGVELMSTEGAVTVVPYQEIKAVCFVRDFEGAQSDSGRKVFLTRPKMDGVWIRMQLRDGEILEGVMPNDLLQVSSLGFTVSPPDPNSNHQKLFVPRAALAVVHVLGVVGSPLRREKKPKPASTDQIRLFD
ncbi:MAG: DUF6982 domain-containing protein [Bryobacteraceae bacterium]